MFNLRNEKGLPFLGGPGSPCLASGLRPGPPNDKYPANNDEEDNN